MGGSGPGGGGKGMVRMQGFDGLGCDELSRWCVGQGNAMDGQRRGPQTVRDRKR
jgi:hypothetical protein